MPISPDLRTRVTAYEAARKVPFGLPPQPASQYVEMKDGCRIAIDVYLPDGGAKTARFPSLLVFTPYFRRFKRTASSTVTASPNTGKISDYFVPRGYAVVVIDVRGTGASFGTRDGFRSPKEREDSAQIADWVIAQAWSNGVLGATGISYLGAASDFLASTGHSSVKAIAPLFSVWDTYSDNYFPGGMQCASLTKIYDRLMMGLDLDQREYLKDFSYYASPDYQGPHPVDEDSDGSLARAAVQEHQGNFRQTDFMADLSYREDGLPYDPHYSSASISPYSYCKGIREDVAILSISGWLDGAGYANGAIARHLTLSRNPRHLVLGPWDHGARIDVSPWRKDEAPDFPVLGCVLRFFDTYLLGADTGLKTEPAVSYYRLHEERWGEAETWPPRTSEVQLFPAAHGALATKQADGQAAYQVDPTLGTGSQTRYERIAGMDSRDYYHDWQGRTARMLSWDSPPLEAPLAFAGHAVLDLAAAFDAPDAGLFVYLSEVEADGSERYVSEGVLRALFRQETEAPETIRITWPYRDFHRESASPLPLGEVLSIRVALLPTAWVFQAGSKLRLSISGADKDHFKKVPHGKPPRITVDLGRTSFHLPLDQEVPIRFSAGTDGFAALVREMRETANIEYLTVLRYEDGGANRLYSTAPELFAHDGFKRFSDAPLMEKVRVSAQPILSDGMEALRIDFPDWETIIKSGCEAVLNLPVRRQDGAALGQINLLGQKGAFSPETIARLSASAARFAGLFLPDLRKEPV
ncbi:CocE/NonD family hydrolase [Breoghania sp. L-A4]|uniref:CocE/NonD family hydrolase n=1 Tax=Breoghania sp. L-A4 TaxID=2304600 RepID=UPI000E35E6E7|nr:CocE/NonD family hydrolase [Breoghania sp. L-A4]AXS40082.1 CocE/NonD family hydrolase [Breoghania sp. L-A4]